MSTTDRINMRQARASNLRFRAQGILNPVDKRSDSPPTALFKSLMHLHHRLCQKENTRTRLSTGRAL